MSVWSAKHCDLLAWGFAAPQALKNITDAATAILTHRTDMTGYRSHRNTAAFRSPGHSRILRCDASSSHSCRHLNMCWPRVRLQLCLPPVREPGLSIS